MTLPNDTVPGDPIVGVAELAREIEPQRDLFSGIEAQIAPHRSLFDFIFRFRFALVATSVTAAAVVLVASTDVPPAADPPALVAVNDPPSLNTATPAGEAPTVDAALKTYREAGDALLAALKARREKIPDDVWRGLQASFSEVDRSLEAIERALDKTPDDPRLLSLAIAAHAQRVAVLSRLVRTFPLS